ncbi:MAG: hypothetical protein FGM52_05640 [Mycobacterium sp.]|nr:hypothetical protein [Mycobacterium sp.]
MIPTLWRPAGLLAALDDYLSCPAVDRVIVIDNDPSQRPAPAEALAKHPRLLLLSQPRNLLVNQAWNLGMAQITSSSTLVGILNDDIHIPSGILMKLLAQAPPPGTVVGLLPAGDTLTDFALEPFTYRHGVSIGSQCGGFGSALFLRRSDFVPIPSRLRIWFGDDWILQHARRILGLRSTQIRVDRHVTMTAMRSSYAFRRQLARDKALAPRLLGWDRPTETRGRPDTSGRGHG